MYYLETSVVSSSCPNYVLDVLSTTIFNLSFFSDINEIIKSFSEEYNCSIDYMIVKINSSNLDDFEIYMTKDLKRLVKSSSLEITEIK